MTSVFGVKLEGRVAFFVFPPVFANGGDKCTDPGKSRADDRGVISAVFSLRPHPSAGSSASMLFTSDHAKNDERIPVRSVVLLPV